jgi:hypothetical protein
MDRRFLLEQLVMTLAAVRNQKANQVREWSHQDTLRRLSDLYQSAHELVCVLADRLPHSEWEGVILGFAAETANIAGLLIVGSPDN